MNNRTIVTRFAPSPTGFMHIGGVRTALFAWAFARKHNGTFILRIEDTDKNREVEGSIEHIMKSLKWLGIEWNEGPDIGGPNAPYIQSQRLDSHRKYAQILIDKGLAYADPYTEEEVEAFRKKSEAENKPFLYRNYRPENPPVWDGTQPLRFKITNVKSYHWEDLARGSLSAGPEALDDFVLIKSDGYPTYNFAHIIDDLEMGVTHIMRSDEFISSTPKFLALYEALEIERPQFVILPPIMAENGRKKLGKRDGAKDAMDYKEEGYLPEAMLNFLVLIGWNPGDNREVLTPAEFIEAFDVTKIQKAGGKYNIEKLDWLNKEHLKRMDGDAQRAFVLSFLTKDITDHPRFSDALFARLQPLIVERIQKGSDVTALCEEGELDYFLNTPVLNSNGLCWKSDVALEEAQEALAGVVGVLEPLAVWEHDAIKQVVMAYTDTLPARGVALHAMRFALSGKTKSPDPFTIASILGKEETLARLGTAIAR